MPYFSVYRDKKMRKASSWKYLVKWESILEEQWNQQNASEYDYRGINLIVPKRKQSFRKQKYAVSSTKEDFLDDMYMKKSSSTECILDRDDDRDDNDFDKLEKKKCVSENDLNRNSLHYLDMYDSNYLLSLKDIEAIGHFNSTVDKTHLSNETSKSTSDIKTANRNNSFHKPKIVGVVVSNP